MKTRPPTPEVVSALATLFEADAISFRHTLDIAIDAGIARGVDMGAEREKNRLSAEQISSALKASS